MVSHNGGYLSLSIDDSLTDVSTVDQSITTPVVSLVHAETGLDPTIVHTLRIVMLGGSSIDIDRVIITAPPPTVIPPVQPGMQDHGMLSAFRGTHVAHLAWNLRLRSIV